MPELSGVARPLSETERRLLMSDLKRSQRQLRSFLRRLPLTVLVIFGTLWVLAVTAEKGRWLFPTVLLWPAGGLILTWIYFSEKPKYDAAIRRSEDAVQRNEAHEISIQSEALVELEEIEDEGACYAFQISNGRIVFVSGQDYYPTARFPNSDFSVIRIFDQENFLVEEFVEKRGSKLKPKRKISAKAKATLNIPAHLEVIEGDLDRLENLLEQSGSDSHNRELSARS